MTMLPRAKRCDIFCTQDQKSSYFNSNHINKVWFFVDVEFQLVLMQSLMNAHLASSHMFFFIYYNDKYYIFF